MIANNASSVNSSSKPHHERKRNKVLAFFKFSSQKQSSVGPFFPSGHSLQSQTTNNSGRIPCAFDEAQDTNAVVASFIAADEETRAILLKRINDIIDKFDISSATLDTVRELVILGRIPDWDTFSRITERFLKAIKDSILLQTTALQGLAVILNSCPEEIDMKGKEGFYSDILGLLRLRLDNARVTQNEGELIPLLHSITTLLNAMWYRDVHALDREKTFNPLKTSLARLESHKNTTVSFLTLYAKQGLNYVGNDESLEKSIFRHGWLAIRIAVDIASGIKNVDWGKFESAFGKLMEMNDISIKALWYSGLVLLDSTMYLQDWTRFEEFALKSKLKSNECFLQGACLRLEQIASTHPNGDIHDGAIRFLYYILVKSPKCVRQVALTILERLGTSHCAKHNGREANRYTLSLICTCSAPRAVKDDLPAIWDPSWHSTSSATLLKHIQQASQSRREIRDTAINVSEMRTFVESTASLCSLYQVRSALKSYYKNSLKVLRVSGDKLDLESCYVNLAIVEASSQRKKDKSELETQAKAFQRMPSRGESTGANIEFSIPLEELFDRRKLRDGDEAEPKRILIYGRAGAGKSTLCKKIVHLFQDGRWRDRFAAIIWLPLRRLKNCGFHTIDDMLGAWYFASHPEPERTTLSRTLQKSGVLYILDGLDEIVTILRSEANFNLSEFFNVLLQQQYVIITSRPSGVDKSILPGIDLEMETVGFSPQNVKDYLSMVLAPDQVQSVQRFIDQTPVVQGLVNIPVQLDVICFSWGSLPTNVEEITITGLYQVMVCKLCRKDAFRLQKKFGEEVLSEYDIDNLLPLEIDELMDSELEYLSYLAFEGLKDNHRIEFDEKCLRSAFLDLDNRKKLSQCCRPSKQPVNRAKETSFLHSTDIDLDVNMRNFQGSWHFLHLTFQEYFAASWVARHLQSNSYDGAGSSVQTMKEFISNEKYNPRYEIMWWMVAGQLKGTALISFFDLLQGAPLDLIGGYHHHLLAACLKESRSELDKIDHGRVESLESQLIEWLQFEKSSFDRYGVGTRRSILGAMGYLPEELLIKSIGQSEGSLEYLFQTLQRRPSITLNAIPILLNALEDENWNVRRLAASTLGKYSTLPDTALQALVGALQDEDWRVTRAAALTLGKQPTLSDSILQALIDALKDENCNIIRSVASALGKQSRLPNSALQALVGALKNEDKYVRHSVLYALGKQSIFPDSALQALIEALKDEHWRVRRSAASILGKQSILPDSALQVLINALKDKDREVRISAASALRSQSTFPDSVLQALDNALDDEDNNVRNSAAFASGKQSTLPDSAPQDPVGALKDNNKNVRGSAVSTLGEQSILPDSALQAVVDTLEDEDKYVGHLAASGLGQQSELPDSVLQALVGALKNSNKNIRSSAVSALGKLSILPESALQALVGALKDERSSIRDSAASVLGKQPKFPDLVLQALVDALKDEDSDVRNSSASLLGKQSTLPNSALQTLIGALQDKSIKEKALTVLEKHSKSLFMAIPDLLPSAVEMLYPAFLVRYGSQHSASLWVQGDQMSFYTAQ
ncbi:hypothetical protein BGZ46_002428, partial [Entomortierella lignicola]